MRFLPTGVVEGWRDSSAGKTSERGLGAQNKCEFVSGSVGATNVHAPWTSADCTGRACVPNSVRHTAKLGACILRKQHKFHQRGSNFRAAQVAVQLGTFKAKARLQDYRQRTSVPRLTGRLESLRHACPANSTHKQQTCGCNDVWFQGVVPCEPYRLLFSTFLQHSSNDEH